MFSYIILNIIGLRTIATIFILFLLPSYLIFSCLKLDDSEKLIFSLFISLAFFPLVVWFVDRVIPSFRISLLVSLILVVSVGLILRKRCKSSA